MRKNPVHALVAVGLSAFCANADPMKDSALIIGKSTYLSLCAGCHGEDAKTGGTVGELLTVQPPDLTKISERSGGNFPFSSVYEVIIWGMKAPGHGPSEMPIWGDYFMSDALEDRGVSKSDATSIVVGRALSLAYYLESIQE